MKNSIIYALIVLILSINSYLKAHIIADEKNALHNDVTDRMREFSHEGIDFNISVSYTHLTLPTKRIV